MNNLAIQQRQKARLRAVQALYQWQLNPVDYRDIVAQFQESQDMAKLDLAYFTELLQQITTTTESLDANIQPWLDKPITQLDTIELTVLRIASYELLSRLDIPYKVIINEAIALTKKYGAADGYKFVNGVLDRAAKSWRPHG